MIAIIMTEKELQEMEYLLKQELDELLYDFEDQLIEGIVKRAMEERYQILFKLLSKVSHPSMSIRYVRTKRYKKF